MEASPRAEPAVDSRAFRRALGRFATGVTLVTAAPCEALVVNAFMSVSLDPPLVAFSVGRCSLTWRRMRRSPRLGVNVLPGAVHDVAERARPGADRLHGLRLSEPAGAVPQLADALAFILCEPVEESTAGDHSIVLCRVLAVAWDETREPVVFFGGQVGTFRALRGEAVVGTSRAS